MDGDRGRKIAGYVAEELIGYGASGQVWRGRTARTGHPVALKRVDCSDPAVRRSARAEAALLSVLDHPGLVRLHELVTDGDALVLVLDLAEGGSLADLLARRGRLSPGEVVTALTAVAAALAYAHDEGVTHSDVSAANVLFTGAGVPLLADLGTARLLGDTSRSQATLAYLDPSVAAGAAPSAPSDVFALAAVALHALSGRPPWTGGSPEQIVALAAAGEIAGLDQRLAGVPRALADVVRRGLNPMPYARGTAAEFALDLRHSCAPIPIELSAGRKPDQTVSAAAAPQPGSRPPPQGDGSGPRPRTEGSAVHRPRHAYMPAVVPGRSPRTGPLDRPAFARPDDAADRSALVGAALTHTVRARARPPAPPPRLTARVGGFLKCRPPRVFGSVIALVLLLGVGASAFVFWPSAGRAGTTPAAAAVPPSVVSSSVEPTLTPTSPTPAATPVGWAHVLSALDGMREQAFAANNPTQLAQVYVPGPLLRQDAAALTRLDRPGCRVEGLRTSYSGVVLLARTAAMVTVRASATLAQARVICGAVVAYTGARPATQLSIGLRPVGERYLIASLQIAA